MDKFAEIRAAITERCTEPGAYCFPDPWWEKEIKVILSDLDAAIKFIENECTDEELYWLSEVFEDIMDRSRSADFLNCLRRRVQRVENDEWKQDIISEILTAAEYIDEPEE